MATFKIKKSDGTWEYIVENQQIQSDWNQTDATATNYIMNKPIVDSTLSHSGQIADAKAVGDAIENKVDKVTGMGLSSNDYTTEEKEKLADLETGSPISLDRIDEICGAIITAGEEARL